MKLIIALAAATAATSSFATVIYSQAPINGADGGGFSYPGQIMADNFRVGSSTYYDHVTFWGSYFFQGDPLSVGTQREFRIRRYLSAAAALLPGTLESDQTVMATVTGKAGFADTQDTIYRFEVAVATNNLLANIEYFLSVISTDTVAGFRWQVGSGSGNAAATSSTGTDTWLPVSGDRGNEAFELSQAVPEPSTYLVMGVGALALLRRRR